MDQNVEYVSEQLDIKDAALEAFSNVFARFHLPPDESSVRPIFLHRNFILALIRTSLLERRTSITNRPKAKSFIPTTIWPPNTTQRQRRNQCLRKNNVNWLV